MGHKLEQSARFLIEFFVLLPEEFQQFIFNLLKLALLRLWNENLKRKLAAALEQTITKLDDFHNIYGPLDRPQKLFLQAAFNVHGK